MKVAVIDVDGRITNLALQKISAYHKALGDEVVLNPPTPAGIDRTYVSLIFSKSRTKALSLYGGWPDVTFGGTGYDLTTTLPPDIEKMRPDFDLYRADDVYERIKGRIGKKENVMKKAQEIVDAGTGFLSRGCVNSSLTCPWCVVPAKEGVLTQVGTLDDLINPRSSKIKILDNSFAMNSNVLEVLAEVKARNLSIDITQGLDIRRITPEICEALSGIRHWGDIKYSWDHPQAEKTVLAGIKTMSKYVRVTKQLCYILVGHSSSFEEDMMRVRKLAELGVRPYAMKFADPKKVVQKDNGYLTARLSSFVQWVNLNKCLYKTVPFEDFDRWVRAKERMAGAIGARQLDLEFA